MKHPLFNRICKVIALAIILLSFNHVSGQQIEINQLESAISQFRSEGKKRELAESLNKLGYLYWGQDNTTKAVEVFLESIKVNEEIGNSNAIKTLCSNIGIIYLESNQFSEAATFFRKSLRINRQLRKRDGITEDLINLAQAQQGMGQHSEAVQSAEEALGLAKEVTDLGLMKTCYNILAECHENLGKSAKALEYYDLASAISKQLTRQQMTQLESRTREAEAETYRKEEMLRNTIDTLSEVMAINQEHQLQIDLLSKEKQLKDLEISEHQAKEKLLLAKEQNRRNILFFVVGVAAILFVFIILVGIQLRLKKKAFKRLEEQNLEIESQKKEIEHQRDLSNKQKQKLTDSIQYAQRIQNAVLPPLSTLSGLVSDSFVLFRPRDIVSGDFYYFTEKEGILIIAAADCTGHGVPGAFMSMLGVAYLNEIVNKMAINKHIRSFHANEVLNQLRENIIRSLHQEEDPRSQDGMDISLAIIDFEQKLIQYAGAHNPLYIIRGDELQIIEADKMPVSIHKNASIPFHNHEISFQAHDKIYLFSDGFVDQLGELDGSKFMAKNFRSLLLKIHHLSMAEQKKELENAYNLWKGNREQVDDVLVIGLHLQPMTKLQKSSNELLWEDRRILIAEDIDINYFLLVEALRPTKIQIVRANTGKEAVEFCRTNPVDLILMDINMPIMNGLEATRQIREFRKDIPIIAQTAQSEEGDTERCLQAGCNDYIAKPIDLHTFIEKIQKHLFKN